MGVHDGCTTRLSLSNAVLMAKELDFEQARRKYKQAEKELRRSEFGKKLGRDRFEDILSVAMSQSLRAAAHNWDIDLANNIPEIRRTWKPANLGALKLAIHLEQLDTFTALKRIAHAERVSGVRIKINKAGTMTINGAFAAFLRGLAKWNPGARAKAGYRLGPISIDKPSRKSLDKGSILTLWLAHLFHRLKNHQDDGPLELLAGDPVTGGAAWEAAAQFASDTWGEIVDPANARKFLSTHKGYIRYTGWPAKPHRNT
jgi:hypothetical protein